MKIIKPSTCQIMISGFFTSLRSPQYDFFRIFLFSIFILSILFQAKAFSRQEPPTNYQVIDSLTTLSSLKIIENLKLKHIDTIQLEINNHPANWLIKEKLIANSAGIVFFRVDSTFNRTLPILNIIINRCSPNLAITEEFDILQRQINIDLSQYITFRDNRMEYLPEVSLSIQDSVGRNQVVYIQNSPFDFAKAPVPEEQKSFFHKIAEPAIIVVAAVVALVLFFTVRTN